MLYADVRHQIRTGDVLLTQGAGWFSRAIRLRTRGFYTHAGFFVWCELPAWSGDYQLCVLEAMEGVGVRLQRFSYYLDHYGGVYDWYQLIDPDTGYEVPDDPVVAKRNHDWAKHLPHAPDNYVPAISRLGIIGHALRHYTGENHYSKLQLLRVYGFVLPRRLREWLIPMKPQHRHCSYLVADAVVNGGGHGGDAHTRHAMHSPAETTPDDISRFTCYRRRGDLVRTQEAA